MVKQDSNNVYICKNDNWMFKNTLYWTISPLASSGYSRSVWMVNSDGCVLYPGAAYVGAFFPAIYLKSNVLIESGNGTSDSPYILKAGA